MSKFSDLRELMQAVYCYEREQTDANRLRLKQAKVKCVRYTDRQVGRAIKAAYIVYHKGDWQWNGKNLLLVGGRGLRWRW